MDKVLALVQKEDLVRWANTSYTNDFAMKHLWYPKFVPFSKLGAFLFWRN
jgi:hypothetical protein